MVFTREKITNYYLHDTAVENVFINEFVPDAPGNFEKTYLFALMYANIRVSMSNEDMAKQLSADRRFLRHGLTGKARVSFESTTPIRRNVFIIGWNLLISKRRFTEKRKNKSRTDKLPEGLKGIISDKDLKKCTVASNNSPDVFFQEKSLWLSWIG